MKRNTSLACVVMRCYRWVMASTPTYIGPERTAPAHARDYSATPYYRGPHWYYRLTSNDGETIEAYGKEDGYDDLQACQIKAALALANCDPDAYTYGEVEVCRAMADRPAQIRQTWRLMRRNGRIVAGR